MNKQWIEVNINKYISIKLTFSINTQRMKSEERETVEEKDWKTVRFVGLYEWSNQIHLEWWIKKWYSLLFWIHYQDYKNLCPKVKWCCLSCIINFITSFIKDSVSHLSKITWQCLFIDVWIHPGRIPFSYLEDIQMRFMKNYGKVAPYAPAYAMNDEFSRVLHQQLEFFSSNSSADTLKRVRGEVSEASVLFRLKYELILLSVVDTRRSILCVGQHMCI